MERLSGLDASFLYIESSTQPLHVCSILELDTSTIPGGYTFDRLRDELALRIKAIPEFRAKLAEKCSSSQPPVIGPAATPTPTMAAESDRPRAWHGSAKMFVIRPSVVGKITAAPTPMGARAPRSAYRPNSPA